MQGVEGRDREFLDAGALVGHLVAEGGMFAFLAEYRRGLFPDDEFDDLFPSGKGRPSIPASVMASILVLGDLARSVRPGDRRGGSVRSSVEGRDRDGAGPPGV